MNEFDSLRDLLTVPLSHDNGPALAEELAASEAWQSRLSVAYREAEADLAAKKRKYLLPKSKDWTDMDRTIQLEASIGPEQAVVDQLSDLADIIKRRISLGQSLLSSIKEEMKATLR